MEFKAPANGDKHAAWTDICSHGAVMMMPLSMGILVWVVSESRATMTRVRVTAAGVRMRRASVTAMIETESSRNAKAKVHCYDHLRSWSNTEGIIITIRCVPDQYQCAAM